MKMINIFIMSIIMFATGCSSIEKKDIEVIKNEKEVKVDFIHPDSVAVNDFETFNFIVITKDNYKDLFKEDGVVFIALKTEDYKKLSRNMQEIIRIVKEQNDIILYYKKNVK